MSVGTLGSMPERPAPHRLSGKISAPAFPRSWGRFPATGTLRFSNFTRRRMSHPIQIDEEQNLAIRTEVAERLRTMHSLEGRQRVPRPIRQSIDRLAELEGQIEIKLEASPPFVPSENKGWLKRLFSGRFR
jgi:hypothetical protein